MKATLILTLEDEISRVESESEQAYFAKDFATYDKLFARVCGLRFALGAAIVYCEKVENR